jgi:copper(I)-binding protein
VQFEPGRLHVMLHALKRTPAVGEDLVLVFELSGGTTLKVSARVRPLTSG